MEQGEATGLRPVSESGLKLQAAARSALFGDHVPVAPAFTSRTLSVLIAVWTSNIKINGTYITGVNVRKGRSSL